MNDTTDSLFNFPCRFPIKAMGRSGQNLTELIKKRLCELQIPLDEVTLEERKSRGGNYVSVTITLTATSREQLDDIYRSLNSCDEILMTL